MSKAPKHKAEKPAEEMNDKVNEAFSHLTDDGRGGFEAINADVQAFPFIRVLQQLSPQCKKNKPEYIEGAEPGMFYNNVTNITITPPMKVVVGRFDRTFIEWKPDRGGFVAAHVPEDFERRLRAGEFRRNERGQYYDPETDNIFQDTYVYYVLLPEMLEEGICLLSLSSTQLKEARRWNRLLTSTFIPGTGRRALPYHMVWSLTTPEQSNDKGDWFGLKVDFVGFVNPQTLELVTEERKMLPSAKPDYKLLEAAIDTQAEIADDDQPF